MPNFAPRRFELGGSPPRIASRAPQLLPGMCASTCLSPWRVSCARRVGERPAEARRAGYRTLCVRRSDPGGNGFGYFPRKESNPSRGGGTPLLAVEIARQARDSIQDLDSRFRGNDSKMGHSIRVCAGAVAARLMKMQIAEPVMARNGHRCWLGVCRHFLPRRSSCSRSIRRSGRTCPWEQCWSDLQLSSRYRLPDRSDRRR